MLQSTSTVFVFSAMVSFELSNTHCFFLKTTSIFGFSLELFSAVVLVIPGSKLFTELFNFFVYKNVTLKNISLKHTYSIKYMVFDL